VYRRVGRVQELKKAKKGAVGTRTVPYKGEILIKLRARKRKGLGFYEHVQTSVKRGGRRSSLWGRGTRKSRR